MNNARFLQNVDVTEASLGPTSLAVFEDAQGGVFAVEASFVDQVSPIVCSPLQDGELTLLADATPGDDELADVDDEAIADFAKNPFDNQQFVLLMIVNLMNSADSTAFTRGALKTTMERLGCSEEQFETALRLATTHYQETIAGTSLQS